MQTIDKKRATDKLNMHTYYLLSVCILFSITCKSIIFVSNDTNYCAFSIVHIIIFISTVDNLMYAFLSLYPDVFTTHLLFNAHKRNQLTGFLKQVV